MNVIGYIRVSTDEQASGGVSLDAQDAKIKAWAALHDHTIKSIHVDAGISGSTIAKRPALLRALEEVERTDEAVFVVYSLSRVSRTTRDAIDIADRLKKVDAQFVSLTEQIDTTSPGGKVFFVILAAFAEYERDLVIERTKVGLDRKRQRGEALGNTPFGWKRGSNGLLEVHQDEQRGLEIIAANLRAGVTNCAKIARDLESSGVRARCGYRVVDGKRKRTRATRWHTGSVRRIVAWMRSDIGSSMMDSTGLQIDPCTIAVP